MDGELDRRLEVNDKKPRRDRLSMMGGGHLGVAEDGGPFAEGEVGGDDDRGTLVEPAHQVAFSVAMISTLDWWETQILLGSSKAATAIAGPEVHQDALPATSTCDSAGFDFMIADNGAYSKSVG